MMISGDIFNHSSLCLSWADMLSIILLLSEQLPKLLEMLISTLQHGAFCYVVSILEYITEIE